MGTPMMRPVIGVGVVVLKDDHVLLIKRGKAPEKGKWSLPGGRQELAEPIRHTARREVREETSVEITDPQLLDVVDSIHALPDGEIEFQYTLVDFWAEWLDGTPVAGDDAVDAQWFPLDEVGFLGLWEETQRVIFLAVEKRNKQSV
ncbi:NUDIX hydrolase [Aestuariispira ectoiniformans]|uniref:NUDIX hydrolase n=1 Tax=Aestuariispira ectoiniformans TaxID=2775080 RepID=UPI00223B6837|nr:NUDIX hydrolase [Aestuariispira ectoiniformans]